MANGGKILWINPLPIQIPKLKGIFKDKGLQNKIINKVRVHMKIFHQENNVYILSPFYLPVYGNTFIEKINYILIRTQIWLAVKAILKNNYIVFATSTYLLLDILDIIAKNKIIFQFADMISSYRHLPEPKRIEFLIKDKKIIERSNIVLCSSKAIRNSLSKISNSNKLAYFPHGVDINLFLQNGSHFKQIPEMEKIPKPVIGYFGSLTDANDKEAIMYCARKKPDWSFVLIGGPIKGDYSALFKIKNIYFMGKINHTDIPHYGKYFDVGLMNWIPHDWIKHCYPLKTLEYLALGLPIVSTPIDEVKNNFSEFVTFATSPLEYLTAIEDCIHSDNHEKRRMRIERVMHETWDSRVDELRKWIQIL
ncbi:MAG: glycosyltransferase [Proteobacteria bacterium]|nr:glycosyltransferase [Pseudomonadota bacterium]